MLDATPYLATAATVPVGQMVGRVARVVGLTIEGRGIGAPIGDLVAIERAGMSELPAEVVGFKEGAALMMPLGDADGLVPGARVRPLHRKVSVGAGRQLLGRVLDALGQPLDGLGPVGPTVEVPLLREAPSPMERRPIDAAL
ncbi:MAG: flagellar protein export ATPase FliI, partial [Planctomycetota bacterium]